MPSGELASNVGSNGEPKRDRWASRTTFIIASVGAAVGLGNIWRFPYLNYKHGGGAFLIPYFFFLTVTGLPLLQAELALGRLTQKGDVEAFGSIHKRARGVGAISAIGGFGVVTYYSSIIAWSIYFFGASFKWPFPWAVDDCAGNETCLANPDRSLPIPSSDAYFDSVINTNEDSLKEGVAHTISGPLFGTLLFTWVFAYFCIWKGVKSVGPAVKLTVVLPWILLAVLIIYNATLDGSRDGVKAYIGEWDLSVLNNGVAWSDAAGQIFFTLGACLGIMSAYGSYAPSTADVYTDNAIICYINCGTSIMAGFAVFSILGNMAYRQTQIASENPELRFNICQGKIDSSDVVCPDVVTDCTFCRGDNWQDGGQCRGLASTDNVAQAGIYLAFSVYPATMQYLTKGGANVLSLMWFGVLWLLGIDSMFAMVEGVATVITDTPRFKHLRKEIVALVTCMCGFIASIAFITDIGFYLLDQFDHYILNYGLIFTGAIESYVVSWVWGWRECKGRTGTLSAAIFTGGFTVASVLGCAIAGALHYAVESGNNIGIGFAIGVGIFAISIVAAFMTRSGEAKEGGFMDWAKIVCFAGSRNLRSTFKHNPKRWETIAHILTFDCMIKYVCFPALLGLFINQAVNDAVNYDSGYGDYPIWLQLVAGFVVLGTMVFFLVVFVIYPGFFDIVGGKDDRPERDRLADVSSGDSNTTDGADVEAGEKKKKRTGSAMYMPTLSKNDNWG